MEQKAYLTLENGDVFEGYSFGAQTETTGELVFTTAILKHLPTQATMDKLSARLSHLLVTMGLLNLTLKAKSQL